MTNQQEDIFITKIHIKDVFHLKDIEIPISETERKHLILTGKNGSGKTSVLRALADVIFKEKRLYGRGKNGKFLYEMANNNIQFLFNKFNDSQFEDDLFYVFLEKNFIFSFFEAQRSLKLNDASGIKKLEFPKKSNEQKKFNVDFLQHLVNLRADRLFAKDVNDNKTYKKIEWWLNKFEKSLPILFELDQLKFLFDWHDYNFYFIDNTGKKFDFNTLSAGYSSLFDIITEIIMRMEGQITNSYEVQGIVLIDEIETHLHISLQKKILPFLTAFFPNIQFIVTTHSPFILNSIENAVVYDLENKVRVENLSGYSVDGLVESYFLSDKYSDELKAKVKRYETLLKQKEYKNGDFEELFQLKVYFDELPTFMAPELSVKLKQLERLKARLHD